MNTEHLTGMIPPLVVPFTKEGSLDEAAFRNELRYLLNSGIDGVSSGGSTGEGALLTDYELKRCLELINEENHNNLPVYAGIIRNSTRDVIKAGMDARALGASALLVTPVFYYGATEAENFLFYKEICEKVQLPVIIYNVVPTNIISPSLFEKINEIEWIVGIKQVDPVRLAEIAAVNNGRYKVYAACDHLLYSSYVAGACGAISALITVAPHLCIQQWKAFKRGDQQKAMQLQKKLLPLVTSYFEVPFPEKIKTLLHLQGRSVGYPLKPMQLVDTSMQQKMKAALTNAGLKLNEVM